MMTFKTSDTPSLSNEWQSLYWHVGSTTRIASRVTSLLRCFRIVKLLSFALRVQRCSWRCHGCQHRSPRSTQDGTHSRWPCPWHPGVRQGTGQVSPRPVHGSYFFCQPHVSLMTFWLPLLSSNEEARHCYPIFVWDEAYLIATFGYIFYPCIGLTRVPCFFVFFVGVRPTFAPLQPTVTSPCTSSWWKPFALSTRSTWSRWGSGHILCVKPHAGVLSELLFRKPMHSLLWCTAALLMIIWLPLLSTMRKLPLLPNFCLKCSSLATSYHWTLICKMHICLC